MAAAATRQAPALDPELPSFPAGMAPVDLPDQEDSGYEDYYGVLESEVWYFPDKKQYIQFQPMNEGMRANFQKQTNRDVTVMRESGDAKLKVDPASERHMLIENSVTGWHLVRKNANDEWKPIPFGKGSPGSELNKWLQVANPKLIDDLEFAIRKANPWMQADMDSAEIKKEIDRLNELLVQVEAREKGEGSSSVS